MVTLGIRVVVIAGAAGLMWTFAMSKVDNQTRLPVAAVVPGATITQPFGCTTLELEPFDPLCPSRHVHTGIDLAAPPGTPVHAATGGTAHVGYDPYGAGLYVAVDLAGQARVLYCHLFSAVVVSGQEVAAGQTIGTVGSSGLATGPHVHFEVQVGGRSVDPERWLAEGGP